MTMHALDLHATARAGVRRGTRAPLAIVAVGLVAAAPAANALATWAPGVVEGAGAQMVRYLSLPVLALELVCIALALAAGFSPACSLRALGRLPAALLAGLVLLTVATAVLVAPDRDTAQLRLVLTTVHLLFGLAFAHLLMGWRDWTWLWWALVGGALAYAALIPVYVAAIPSGGFDWIFFGLGVNNIRHTGFILLPAAALALGLAAQARGRAFVGACGAATICCALFFWSGSRAPVAALVAACAIAAAMAPPLRTRRLARALGLALVSGYALSHLHAVEHPVYGATRIARTGTLPNADAMASGRVELWTNSVAGIARRPWFGHGEGQFGELVTTSLGAFAHPHNAVLQLLFQWGAAGLLLTLALAGTAWWRVLRGVREGRGDAAPAFLALTALALYAQTDGVLFFTTPLMLLATFLAAGLTAARAPSGRA